MKKNYILFFALLLLLTTTQAQQVFLEDYGTTTFTDFGGSTNVLTVDNTIRHTGVNSLKVSVPAAGYTGGAFVNATPISLVTYNALTFWVKASKAATLNVAGIGNNGASTVYASEYTAIALTTTWTKIIIPIPNPAKLTSTDALFHFAEGSDEGVYNIWFDDVQYETLGGGIIGTPTAAFTTETVVKTIGSTFTINGGSAVFPVNSVNQTSTVAPAYFTYTSSNTSVATVDPSTGVITAMGAGSADITAMLGSVAATGTLTVSVVAASNPTTPAPTPPVRNTSNVISLYSNAYTNVPVDTWSAVWDQADVADVTITGNDTKKYTNINYAGVEFTSQVVNATAMTFFHIDIWTPNSTTFKVKLVDFGANGTYGGGDDTEHELAFTPLLGQWISYDIPLTDFTNLTARAHLAQLILVGSISTIYVDNVYFYKNTLPVKLVDFSVYNKGTKALLQWNTASESNNKGFYIQHSINGENWSDISFVAGKGTSNINNKYEATDANPVNGINYYRLKQIDFDGKYSYSPIKTINFNTRSSVEISLFPNPARESITISVKDMSVKTARYEIIDATGKVLRSGMFKNAFENSIQTSLNVKDLPNGVYVLKVQDGNNYSHVNFAHN